MINKEEIFVNEKYWRNMSDIELDLFARKIFQFYRENGFPYYSIDKIDRDKEFNKLMNYDRSNLIVDKIIKQTMHGLGLAWSYFPHAFNVKCNGKMTPYEAFMDDEILMKVIEKRLKMGTYISDSGIRKMLKIYSTVQAVSNFRPTAAAAIYDRFAKNGVVWDMSGGWGGRLLGAIVSGVKEYIATEPSSKTCKGLIELANDYGKNISYQINCCGSEEYRPKKESLDLCFTSPPYFNLEKYSNELSQSYIKFKSLDEWIDGYLKETFKRCLFGLKNRSYLLINIANIKNGNLEDITIQTAKDVGFEYVDKFNLALSNVNLKNKNKTHKFEPIYIFVKWNI